jgi:hypothetical protein
MAAEVVRLSDLSGFLREVLERLPVQPWPTWGETLAVAACLTRVPQARPRPWTLDASKALALAARQGHVWTYRKGERC